MKTPRYTSPPRDTALVFMLKSLVPYTNANLLLAFKPNAFFNELERIDRYQEYSRNTLRKTYYKAKNEGYIKMRANGRPVLTQRAHDHLNPFVPRLVRGSHVMVVFDIPEDMRGNRRYLRALLKELKFRKIQRSVWISDLDCKAILRSEIRFHKLQKYVQVYESARII